MAHRAREQRGEEQPIFAADILKRALYLGLPLLLWIGVGIPNLVRSQRNSQTDHSPLDDIRIILAAEITYADTYKAGYSPSLAALGPPAAGTPPSASAADLIDSVLAGGSKLGYTFTYRAGPCDAAGHIKTFTVVGRPAIYGETGSKSYFTDDSGIIRQTNQDRPATPQDPPFGA
jgi:hypothetical protein